MDIYCKVQKYKNTMPYNIHIISFHASSQIISLAHNSVLYSFYIYGVSICILYNIHRLDVVSILVIAHLCERKQVPKDQQKVKTKNILYFFNSRYVKFY